MIAFAVIPIFIHSALSLSQILDPSRFAKILANIHVVT